MNRPVIRGSLLPFVFLAAYLLLDWATFIHEPPAINITPWNPPIGLCAALLLTMRLPGAIALSFLALMAADLLVRETPAAPPVLVLTNLLVVASYSAGAWVAKRRLNIRPALDRVHDIAWLVVVFSISAIAASLGFTVPHAAVGLLSWPELPAIALQYWIGDVIAILTVTPFILLHLHRTPWNGPRRSWTEIVAHAVAVVIALAVIFNPLVPDPSKLLYVLFPPIIWIAMRRGAAAATTAVLAAQIGVIVGLSAITGQWQDLTYYQAIMVSLAGTGLMAGAVVSERWGLEANLGERRAELARVARLSLIGEMASSLAHELNQPLFTTVGYTKAGHRLLMAGADREEVGDLMTRAVSEAERAAGVLCRIRGFLRQDGSAAAVDLSEALGDLLVLARSDARHHGITIAIDIPPDLPRVWMDPVQFDQVMLNLLRNSVDALAGHGDRNRAGEIKVSARLDDGMVAVSVADAGPGVPTDKIGPLFDMFFTTKPSGMGLGLPICRSIVEAHGGRLWLASNGSHGACFSFTIPAVTHA